MKREPNSAPADSYVRWFRDIRLGDVPTVGGKTASLGELYCALSERDIRVPNGFALTAQAYRDALSGAQALDKPHRLFDGLDKAQVVVLSVGVMKIVRSDRAASGVVITLDTESGFRDVVFITGAYGLGENVVQGAVDPDEFYVHKPTFREG